MASGPSKTLNGVKRIRLDNRSYTSLSSLVKTPEAMEARKQRMKNVVASTPKGENGKVLKSYRYKQLISAYNELGMKPGAISPKTNFTNSKPLFVRDPLIEKSIIKLLEEGMPHLSVCRYVGVSHGRFIQWLKIGSQGVSPIYTKFYRAVCRAEAKAERALIKNLKMHEKTDWRASSWQLERRWPENWAKRDGNRARVEVNATITVNRKEDLSRTILSDANAKELARKMIDNTSEVSREADDASFTEEQS